MALLPRNPRNATGAPPQSDDEVLHTRDITPGVVRSRWDIIKRVQIRERREFWINQAFYLDEQWIKYDKIKQTVARVEFRDPTRLRLTINRIRPNLNQLMAKLTQRDLDFQVIPEAPDDALATAARVAEQVLTSKHDEQRWENLRKHELMACYLGGTSAVAVEWDPAAGKKLSVTTEEGRQVGTGDVKLSSLVVTEFGLQPGVRNPDDANWWVRAVAVPPALARDQYNLDYTPEPDASSEQTLVLLYDSSWRPVADRCLVLTYYERPSAGNPSGCVGTVIAGEWVDGPKPWPFPWKDRLNISVFRQSMVIGRWTGDTILASARPVQIAYNHARSNIAEHLKMAGNARLMVPDSSATSSVFDQLTDEPGEVIPYNQTLGEPKYLSPPNLPAWMIEHAKDLRDEIDNIMGVSTPPPSEAPEAGMSGYALAQLHEKDDTPLGLMAHDQAQGWGWIGTMVLKCYEKMAKETRTSSLPAKAGIGAAVRWDGKALRGQTTVNVPLESILPHGRVAQQQLASELAEKQIVTSIASYAAVADLPNAEQLIEAVDADVAKAQRENHIMSQGHPRVPSDFDDHAKHIAEHNRYRKSADYEQLDPQAKSDVDLHLQAHESMAHAQAGEQRIRNELHPDLATVPQADEPPGSAVPQDNAEQKAANGAPSMTGAPTAAPVPEPTPQMPLDAAAAAPPPAPPGAM